MSLLNNDSDRVNNSASVTGPSDVLGGAFWGNGGLRVVVDVVGIIWVKVLAGLSVGICGLTFHAFGTFGCWAAGGWGRPDDDGRGGNSSLEGGCWGRFVVDVDWVGWITLLVVVDEDLWVVVVDDDVELWVVVEVEEEDLWVVVEVEGARVVVDSSFPLKNPANPLKNPFFFVVVSGANVVDVVGAFAALNSPSE